MGMVGGFSSRSTAVLFLFYVCRDFFSFSFFPFLTLLSVLRYEIIHRRCRGGSNVMLGGQPLGLWKEGREGNGRKRNEEGKKRYVVPGVVCL